MRLQRVYGQAHLFRDLLDRERGVGLHQGEDLAVDLVELIHHQY
jgi:hypothetical protein